MVSDELERIWKEAVVVQSKNSLGICLDVLWEVIKILRMSDIPGKIRTGYLCNFRAAQTYTLNLKVYEVQETGPRIWT
jgi:hypothetical protein